MKRLIPLFLPVIGGMILLSSCNTTSTKIPFLIGVPQLDTEAKTPSRIVEYQTSNSGEDIPDWVALYLAEGISGIEDLPRYENRYVFIAINSGTNFKALNYWISGFTLNQDFSQLVARRVLSRFIVDSQMNPDRDYSMYFEAAVKAAADASFSDSQREADFWLLKRIDENAGDTTESREVYNFYILISIAKEQLQFQLNQIFIKAMEDISMTRDQTVSMNRFWEKFYEGF
jgi:hypothetical protein